MKIIDASTSQELKSKSFLRAIENRKLKILFNFDQVETSKNEISLKDVKRISNLYSQLLDKVSKKDREKFSGQLEFRISQDILYIDNSFFCVIYLFKKSFPSLEFIIDASSIDVEDNTIVQKISDIMVSSYFTDSSSPPFFFLRKKNFTVQSINADYIKRNFPFSREYLPFVAIDGDNFSNDFLEPFEYRIDIPFDRLPEDRSKNDTYAFTLYKALRNYYIDKIHEEPKNAKSFLYLIYYLKLTENLDMIFYELPLLRSYQYQNSDNSFVKAISSFDFKSKNKIIAKNREEIKSILNLVRAKPAIFILLYSIIVENAWRGGVTKATQEPLIDQLRNLYELTKNLFRGLKELASNIIEHSSNHRGVMTVRLFSQQAINLLKETDLTIGLDIKNYLQSYGNSLQVQGKTSEEIEKIEFLDILVMDDSDNGVLDTYLETLEKINSKKGEHLHRKDDEVIKKIKKGKLSYSDLFDSNKILTDHEARRSAANLGLLIFLNAISKNDGIIYSTTKISERLRLSRGAKKEFEISSRNPYEAMTKSKQRSVEDCVSSIGTYYNILIPMDKGKNPNPIFIPELSPMETPQESTYFEELTKFRIVSIDELNDKHGKSKIPIIRLTFSETFSLSEQNNNSEDFYHEYAKEKLKNLKGIKSNCILLLDVKNSIFEKDDSALYRLLAFIQFNINFRDVIVVNCSTELVKYVIEDAKLFEHSSIGIWSDENAVLFYSFDNTLGENYKIYFADILTGTLASDMLGINERIGHTHLTFHEYSSMTNNNNMPSSALMRGLKHSILFSQPNLRLNNFELIINDGNFSLFEHSLSSILNKAIVDYEV